MPTPRNAGKATSSSLSQLQCRWWPVARPLTLTVPTFDGGIETVGTVIFIVVIVVAKAAGAGAP